MRSASVRRLFVALVAVTALYRFSLLGHGATAFVDETFYFTSVKALESLATGDLRGAVADIAQSRGRNGAAILQLPVAALQAIPAHFGEPASNLRSLLIPTSVNVAVTLLSLYFVFSIGVILCGNEAAALVAAVVYASLVNSNIYVRHVLPYDLALCTALLALWLSLTRPRAPGLPIWTGALTGLALTIYTGYYLLCGVLGVTILWQAWTSGTRKDALRFAAIFAASSAAVLIATELLFRLGGLSYLGSLRDVHRDIVFTSYDDGWGFLPAYLLDVERLSGVVLVAGAVAYACRLALLIRQGALRPIDRLMLPMLVAWAAQSSHLNAIPLFGRMIHPWMPVMAWMLADSLAAVGRAQARAFACASVVGMALMSWAFAASEYWPLKYPPDVLYEKGIDTAQLSRDQMLCELYPGTSYASPAPLNRTTRAPYADDRDYILLNFCQALPAVTRPRTTSTIPAGATLLFDGPHWMTYPAYAYEGLIKVDRDAIRKDGYRLEVFRAPAQMRSDQGAPLRSRSAAIGGAARPSTPPDHAN